MSLASVTDDMPLDPDDELLVAYLDGELSREVQTDLENRLLDEEPLRSRLQHLQAGWDMLEELPGLAPNTKLVETTLELAVADIVKAKPSKHSRFGRFRWPMSIAAASLIGVFGAVLITAMIRAQRYDRELRDLAIAESLDAYNYGGDLELMRQLAADPAWAQMVMAGRELSSLQLDSGTIATVPIDQREPMIEQLPIEERAQLYSRWERFKRLDETSRDRIRRTAEAVAQQPDRDSLLKSMQSYAIWRESLPDEVVDEIESTSSKERRDAIKGAIEQTMVLISQRSSMMLNDESIERIYFVLRQILQGRLEDRSSAVAKTFGKLRKMAGGRDPEWGAIFWMFGARDARSRGIPPQRLMDQRPEPLRQEELEMIHLILPPDDIETLDLIAGGDPLPEAMTLKMWAEEAIRRKAPGRRHDDATLLERYNELPASEREEIDLLPPQEILKELTRQQGRFPG